MHGRNAVPLGTLVTLFGCTALGIWVANFIIPSFTGPPWQTVVAIVGIAAVVGVVGRPTSQLESALVRPSTEADPEPRRPLRNVGPGAHDAFPGGAIVQPAFQPSVANAANVRADRMSDGATPL